MTRIRDFAIPLAATLAAATAVLLLPSSASSQEQQCAPRDIILQNAKDKYNEVILGGGLITQSAAMVVLMSPDGETWTLVSVTTTGLACVVASGSDWHMAPIPNGDEGQS